MRCFGDGAGAVVLGEVPPGYGLLGVDLGADGRGWRTFKDSGRRLAGNRRPWKTVAQGTPFHYYEWKRKSLNLR